MKARSVPQKLLEKAAMGWCERLLVNAGAPFAPPSELAGRVGEYELFKIKNLVATYMQDAGCRPEKVREVLQHEN